MLPTQLPLVRFSAFSKICFDVAEIYRRRWFEESGQGLENLVRAARYSYKINSSNSFSVSYS